MNRVRLRSTVATESGCDDNEISENESLRFHYSGRPENENHLNNEIAEMLRFFQGDALSLNDIKLLEFSNILNDSAATTLSGNLKTRNFQLHTLRIVKNTMMTSSSAEKLASLVQCHISSLIELDLSKNPQLFSAKGTFRSFVGTLHASECLTRLNLSDNSIGRNGNAVKEISKLLRQNQSIRHLNLSYNHFTPRHMSTDGGLFNNETLRTLDLSNNDLRDTGVGIIIKAIVSHGSKSILEELNASNNLIGCIGAKAIRELLLNSNNNNKTLRKLDLSHNSIGTDGKDHLRRTLCYNHTLKEVNISSNNLFDIGNAVDVEMWCITEHSKLIRLDLAMTMLNDNDAIAIAETISNHGTLEILNLSSNSIQSDGMGTILKAVPYSNSLKELWLHNNKIKDEKKLVSFVCDVKLCKLEVLTYDNNPFNQEQLENIKSAFQFHNNMKTWLGTLIENVRRNAVRDVRLSTRNVIFGDRELDVITSELARHPGEITTVHLDGDNITDASIRHFAHKVLCSNDERLRVKHLYCYNLTRLQTNGIGSIAQCLRMPNSPLLGLTLCNCNVGPEAAAEIACCLENNQSLKLLNLQSNRISDRGAQLIFAAVLDPPHPTLQILNLSNNRLTDTALEGLGRFDRIVDVLLHQNDITDRGVLDICKAVMETTSLQYLNLRDNPNMSWKGIQTLQLFLHDPFVLDVS